jgi:hypothetical protein
MSTQYFLHISADGIHRHSFDQFDHGTLPQLIGDQTGHGEPLLAKRFFTEPDVGIFCDKEHERQNWPRVVVGGHPFSGALVVVGLKPGPLLSVSEHIGLSSETCDRLEAQIILLPPSPVPAQDTDPSKQVRPFKPPLPGETTYFLHITTEGINRCEFSEDDRESWSKLIGDQTGYADLRAGKDYFDDLAVGVLYDDEAGDTNWPVVATIGEFPFKGAIVVVGLLRNADGFIPGHTGLSAQACDRIETQITLATMEDRPSLASLLRSLEDQKEHQEKKTDPPSSSTSAGESEDTTSADKFYSANENLMDRIADGDPEALATAYTKYHPMILRVIEEQLHDLDASKDLAQEVFQQLRKNPNRNADLNVWLIAVARTLIKLKRRSDPPQPKS